MPDRLSCLRAANMVCQSEAPCYLFFFPGFFRELQSLDKIFEEPLLLVHDCIDSISYRKQCLLTQLLIASGGVINDTLYIVGGRRYSQTNVRDTVFELDLTNSTAEWQTSTGHLPVSRGGLSGGAVGTQFYAFGGEGDPDTTTGVYPQADVFDTESQQWTELANMQVPRHGTQAAVVDGLIYIPGGGLQQDGKSVTVNNVTTTENPTNFFDAYCA